MTSAIVKRARTKRRVRLHNAKGAVLKSSRSTRKGVRRKGFIRKAISANMKKRKRMNHKPTNRTLNSVEFNKGYDKGYDEGYDQGFTQGYSEGNELGQEESYKAD